MSTRVEGNECPNQGRHGFLCRKKKGRQRVTTKSYVNDGNKGFYNYQMNKE
jgi:hypothetical protein